MILDRIHSPEDLRALDGSELPLLCDELRGFLVTQVSRTGGHLASNLGVVELTVAIHRVFDTSRDRLVFDVGHQCYTHKILTGRREQFSSLRQYGGLSGFPKPRESGHDAFIAGHASNSVSVALGMARARTLQHQDYSVLALIGDGALSGSIYMNENVDVGGLPVTVGFDTAVSSWAYDAAETAALQETQFEVATGEELAALQSRASERLQQKLFSLLSLIPAEFLELFE